MEPKPYATFGQNVSAGNLNDASLGSSRESVNETKDNVQSDVQILDHQSISIQQRLQHLNQCFKEEAKIVEDLKELAKLHLDIVEQIRLAKSPELTTQFEKLRDQLGEYCAREGDALLNKFRSVIDIFTRMGLNPPEDIRQEILQAWNALEPTLRSHLSFLKPADVKLLKQLDAIQREVDVISKNSAATQTRRSVEPLRLRNIGNSCYLDSVLQAFLAVDAIVKDLSIAPVFDEKQMTKDQFQKKLAIHSEILQFLNIREMNQKGVSKLDLEQLQLNDGPSLHRLREEIFKSKFHYELSDMGDISRQHDAASVAELFVDHFLPNCRFKSQQYAQAPDFPGLEFYGQEEDCTLLRVPLDPPEYQKLDQLVHWVMYKRWEREADHKYQRFFDPNDGVIVNEVGAASKMLEAHRVKEYIQWWRFKDLPPVLTLLFIRSRPYSSGQSTKDERPVKLPEDGVLDLTRYYDPKSDGPKQAKYKIKSYVSHSGQSMSAGHYVTYSEIDGKYYICDDLDMSGFRQITKNQFFERVDAYLVVLERLADELSNK